MLLLDTTVLIDLLRRKPAALDYIHSLEREAFLSVLTMTELMAGARNAKAEEEVLSLRGVYDFLPVTDEIAELGGRYSAMYTPSHGTGVVDALLAATATVHGFRLVTHNLRHFPMIKDAQIPYAA